MHDNVNNNILIKDKEHNKNSFIFKNDKRDLSVKQRQDNFSLNKKSHLKEKYNSNNDKKIIGLFWSQVALNFIQKLVAL